LRKEAANNIAKKWIPDNRTGENNEHLPDNLHSSNPQRENGNKSLSCKPYQKAALYIHIFAP